MRELTNERPKPMLLAQGKPILEHIFEGLIAANIRELFIVTGFCAEIIEDYFSDGAKWGVRITYGRQLVQDGTGKAPELAKSFIGRDSFLLTYGDILVKPETYRLYEESLQQAYDALTTVEDALTSLGMKLEYEHFRLGGAVDELKPLMIQIRSSSDIIKEEFEKRFS